MPPENNLSSAVRSYALPAGENLFDELSASVRFENTGKGRQGAVLVRPDEISGIPIVRTTTAYKEAAQGFRPVHERLAHQIQQTAGLLTGFNNALVENYTNDYRTMGAHSDQALDLADESFIAVFSCYQNPEPANPPRKLLFESKETRAENFEILLFHYSVVVFSVADNRQLKHKIVLDAPARTPENEWLGITFRTSKTFLEFLGENAFFANGEAFTMATDDQRREFYQLRRRENGETDFIYPYLTYTVSESDLRRPELNGNASFSAVESDRMKW